MKSSIQNSFVATDAEIINKITAGETAFYEVLIRRYNGVLYKIARGYGFNHQDAEDLMQETHVAAYKALPQFSFKSAYKTWLSKIMIHKCLYKLNHGKGRQEIPAGDSFSEGTSAQLNTLKNLTPVQSMIHKEFAVVLEKTIQSLPLSYREVFVLREVEGFSVAETSDLLQITPVNVKVRLNRAKAVLKKALEQAYPLSSLYEFNLVYCDEVVRRVFKDIQSDN